MKIVGLDGVAKRRKYASEIRFNFTIESVVCLSDSILAFYKHGIQGRELRSGEVTQELTDTTRLFHLVGADRVILVETRSRDDPMSNSSLYVLTGAHDA